MRIITAVVAFMIFNSFVREGEKRGKLSENYKNAYQRWLALFDDKLSREAKTQSPAAFLAKTRGIKALGLIVSAVLTGVAIGSATIMLDWTGLLGTVVSLIMMIVWGYLKMLEVEDYFTNGYPEYVIVLEHKLAIEAQNKSTEEPQNSNSLVEEQNDNNRQQNLS
ncbi:MAG: hypothetical protein Q4E99_03885 [Bacillota bacterium]|nr:hypothetical protein [Bacillota bacterium]